MKKIELGVYLKDKSSLISCYGVFLALFIFINSEINTISESQPLLSFIILVILILITNAILVSSENKKEVCDLPTSIFKISFLVITLYLAIIAFSIIELGSIDFIEKSLVVGFTLLGAFLGYYLAKWVIRQKFCISPLLIPGALAILIWIFFLGGNNLTNNWGIKIAYNTPLLQIPISNLILFFLFALSFTFIFNYKNIINTKKIKN